MRLYDFVGYKTNVHIVRYFHYLDLVWNFKSDIMFYINGRYYILRMKL